MKECVHKGVVKIVGTSGTVRFNPEVLERLIYYSIEPDIINRDQLNQSADKLAKKIKVGIKWFADHSLRAKPLALYYITLAKECRDNDQHFLQYLGWASHFIVDYATPHHSLTSKSNPIMNQFKLKNQESNSSVNLIGNTISTIINIFSSKKAHDRFETQADFLWANWETLIKQYYFKHKQNHITPSYMLITEGLDKIHHIADNLPQDWIYKCNIYDYSKFMTKIMNIIDITNRYVIKNE